VSITKKFSRLRIKVMEAGFSPEDIEITISDREWDELQEMFEKVLPMCTIEEFYLGRANLYGFKIRRGMDVFLR